MATVFILLIISLETMVYRSYYKGHKAKIKGEGRGGGGSGIGWGRVEGWGENADNCNWITIKNKIKKRQLKKIK